MIRNNVREYREKAELTQKKLAELCGIGQSTLAEIETGRHAPSLEIAFQISKVLKVSIYNLFWAE